MDKIECLWEGKKETILMEDIFKGIRILAVDKDTNCYRCQILYRRCPEAEKTVSGYYRDKWVTVQYVYANNFEKAKAWFYDKVWQYQTLWSLLKKRNQSTPF